MKIIIDDDVRSDLLLPLAAAVIVRMDLQGLKITLITLIITLTLNNPNPTTNPNTRRTAIYRTQHLLLLGLV